MSGEPRGNVMPRERLRLTDEPQVPVLNSSSPLRSVSQQIARMAYVDYAARYSGQSFEQLHARGGFSAAELIEHLAERVAHLEAESAAWRARALTAERHVSDWYGEMP